MFNSNSYIITWEKARSNLSRLQRRIFKAIYIGDFTYALKLQKLLIASNSARLISIRNVTQGSKINNFTGIDNKVSLTFSEKFKINNFLLQNVNNWNPGKYKDIFIRSDDTSNLLFNVRVWSIADRCWHYLIQFALAPAHEASFSSRNFSFNGLNSIYKMQKVISLNIMKESYGSQKRVLIICFPDKINIFSINVLLRKVLAPRSIKLGIFRFLKSGLNLYISNKFGGTNPLGYLLSNILIDEIDSFFNSVRVGSNFLIFLRPYDSEVERVERLIKFLMSIGIDGV